MEFFNLSFGSKIYISGIGGIGTSALAKHLFLSGFSVCGSDVQENEQTQKLKKMGIPVYQGHNLFSLKSASLHIYTDAVGEDDLERVFVKEQKILSVSRMEALSAICCGYRQIVTVAGSHGKTSTTAMCAHIFKSAKLRFTAYIGGEDKTFSNFYYGGRDLILSEACEYKKNLLAFPPVDIAVLLNVEKDHLECYDNEFEKLKACFSLYVDRAKSSVVYHKIAKNKVEESSFGVSCGDYQAENISQSGECYAFTVRERGKRLFKVRLKVSGYFQIENALAAIAVARKLKIKDGAIIKGLASFSGVKRRFEKLGKVGGAIVYADYAHHPTEIEKTVELARKKSKGRLFVVFQPHTYSRTLSLMEEFVSVLSNCECKNLIIYKTYPAREEMQVGADAYSLHEKIKNSLYAESKRELKNIFSGRVEKGDTLLFLGAGDIYTTAQELCSDGSFKK